MGGPEMAPPTPQRSERPGTPVALLDLASRAWGPEMAPNPPAFGAPPGETRGAPRLPAPDARGAPAKPWHPSILRQASGRGGTRDEGASRQRTVTFVGPAGWLA